MIELNDALYKDFEKVQQIPVVPTMLDVICSTTGMRFAAVARVTDNRWLACRVRDDIQFGLQAGEELAIETTICNEIRDHRHAVIIDHVAESAEYRDHHTPRMYGIQSYISFPIILKNGEFFGTLCAIDPSPAELNNPKIIGIFSMFADLLSFHLQSLDLMERSYTALQESNRQLNYSQDELRQYRQISNHNLQEPLRKLRLFTDILVNQTAESDIIRAKEVAVKINSFAQELSTMIQHLSDFSALQNESATTATVDLNTVVATAAAQLENKLSTKQLHLQTSLLPAIHAVPAQMMQLFFYLISTLTDLPRSTGTSGIRVSAQYLTPQQAQLAIPAGAQFNYCEINVEDAGVMVDKTELNTIFDILVRFNDNDAQSAVKYGAGLANCRKIVHHHGGILTAQPMPAQGIAFSIVLPVSRN